MIRRACLPILLSLPPFLPALAEEAETTATLGSITLDPVMVDARRWAETPDEVPGSVTALSGDQIARPAWDRVDALRKVAPNVQIEESSVQTRVVLRGMTAANTGLQDPVGYFVNDVALPGGASQAPRLFDVSRMELLKGPQGALYGRNTEAGAVKVVTADPSWTPRGWLSVAPGMLSAAGQHEGRLVTSAGVSGPVVADRLAVSLAARAEGTDGLQRNLYDGDGEGGRTRRLTFSSGLTAWLTDATDLTVKSVVENSDLGKRRMRYATGPAATGRYVTNYNSDAYDNVLTAVQSVRLDRRFQGADLTTVAGWSHFDHTFQMDLDTSTLPSLPTLMDHTDDALSLEARLASPEGTEGWRWLGGLYGFHQWTDLDYSMSTPRIRRVTEIEQTGLAGFGQVEVPLAERLRLEAGGRLEWTTQEGTQTYDTVGGHRAYDRDLTEVAVLPRLSLSYDLTGSVLSYVSLARGYLPGGYNYSMATDAGTLAYDPEYSWTAEAGVKTRVLADRLGLGVALFQTRTRDKQVLDLVPGGAQTVSNAARAKVTGLEVSADARPAPRWTVYASLGLQEAELEDFTANKSIGGVLTPVDLSGRRLPMAADVTYSLGARYDTGGEGLFGEAGLSGSGPYYFDSDNTLKQPAAVTVDAELGYRLGAAAEVSLWGTNLFDETRYARAVSTPRGAIVEDAQPREVGLRLTMRW